MAIVNGYCTLAELKARLSISDSGDDAILEAVIEAASRAIDGACNRFFYQTGAGQIRYFSVASDILVLLDDCSTVTAVATDRNLDRNFSTVISLSDVELGPLSASAYGKPFSELRIKPLASESFDYGKDMLKVTGTWGWPAIPDAVNEACLLQAGRLFKRKDAPFGVTGGGEVGTAISLRAVDPDVLVLLGPYRRIGLIDLV